MKHYDSDGYRWAVVRLWPFKRWLHFHFYTAPYDNQPRVRTDPDLFNDQPWPWWRIFPESRISKPNRRQRGRSMGWT